MQPMNDRREWVSLNPHSKHLLCVICGQDGAGQWLSMDSEIIMKNGEPIGTQGPTGHYVLLDAHFELPSGMSSASYLCHARYAQGGHEK